MFLGFVKTYKPRFLKLTSTALLPPSIDRMASALPRMATHSHPGLEKPSFFLQIFRFSGFNLQIGHKITTHEHNQK